ncbi:ATP-binding protein [Actinomadura fibrosa]|uniref:ATP-binding protein n=1 Tax=Actinomadura fibrosa TaxID=111802 RepID=A0ABW2XB72_9ACTN|nr:ATP-binding protein [Actinomadura fibrosa]
MSVPSTAPPCRDTATPGTRPPLHDGGDYRDVVGLAALPTSIPLVRAFARAKLSAWGLDADHGWDCQQVLSELVTNAFDVTGELLPDDLVALDELAVILIQLRISAKHLIVEVRDSGAGRPQIPDTGLNDEGGRGLRLATMLAGAWGWYPVTTPKQGKVVWASWALDRKAAS